MVETLKVLEVQGDVTPSFFPRKLLCIAKSKMEVLQLMPLAVCPIRVGDLLC